MDRVPRGLCSARVPSRAPPPRGHANPYRTDDDAFPCAEGTGAEEHEGDRDGQARQSLIAPSHAHEPGETPVPRSPRPVAAQHHRYYEQRIDLAAGSWQIYGYCQRIATPMTTTPITKNSNPRMMNHTHILPPLTNPIPNSTVVGFRGS